MTTNTCIYFLNCLHRLPFLFWIYYFPFIFWIYYFLFIFTFCCIFLFQKTLSPSDVFILTSNKIKNEIAYLILFKHSWHCHVYFDLTFATACTKIQMKLAIAVLDISKTTQNFQHGNEICARMDIHLEE